jgi:hypothetical protein
MTPQAARIVPLAAAARRRPAPEQRAVYERARLRVAGLRKPPPPLARLVDLHD